MKEFLNFFLTAITLIITPSLFAVTFTVSNTNDSGTGSLRKALSDANIASGNHLINFNIPGLAPHTITLSSALPNITRPNLVIDGTTQPANGYAGVSPKIILNINSSSRNGITFYGGSGYAVYSLQIINGQRGINLYGAGGVIIGAIRKGNVLSGNQYGIFVDNGSHGTRITGNLIGTDTSGTLDAGNSSDGIFIASSNNTVIGGALTGERNIISGNNGNGITVDGTATSGTLIKGNYIGTDINGTIDIGNNGSGIVINSTSSNGTIGGNLTGEGNTISGNDGNGIFITGTSVAWSNVKGNFIGTDKTGTNTIGNSGDGIHIATATSATITIGGNVSGDGNVISGNGGEGIELNNATMPVYIIKGNKIGTDISGKINLGNAQNGILVKTKDTQIGGNSLDDANFIGYNGFEGIKITGGTATNIRNKIQRNQIFCNSQVSGIGGIILSNGNNNTPAPVISSGSQNGANGTSSPNAAIELFYSDSCTYKEGRIFIAAVTANSSGVWSFSGRITGGNITATATTVSNGTSPFSISVHINAPPCDYPFFNPPVIFEGCGLDYTQATVRLQKTRPSPLGLGVTQPANFNITLPPGAVIQQGFLWFTALSTDLSPDPLNGFTIRNPNTGVIITPDAVIVYEDLFCSTCWGSGTTVTYRVPVPGNFFTPGAAVNYEVNNLPVNTILDVNGATLFVIYTLPCNQTSRNTLVIQDGLDVIVDMEIHQYNVPFPPIGNTFGARGFIIGGDIESNLVQAAISNGPVNTITPPNFYNFEERNINLSSGQNNVLFNVQSLENPNTGESDCFNINVLGVYYQTADPTCSPVIVTIEPNNIICKGSCASLTATATGGASVYTYSWNSGQTGSGPHTVCPIITTTYTVTVQDINGCSLTSTTTVPVNDLAIALGPDITICSNQCLNISSSRTGGVAPFTYLWNTGQTTPSLINVCPVQSTTYTLTVTDAIGCSATDSRFIEIDGDVASAGNDKEICFGKSVVIGPEAGNANCTVQWSPATGLSSTTVLNPTASPAVTTIYTVTCTTPNGCTSTSQMDVDVHPSPTAVVTGTKAGCSTTMGGTGSVTASGGNPPLSYTWNTSPVQNTPTATGLSAGTYTVTVTDEDGCTAIGIVTIEDGSSGCITTPIEAEFADCQVWVNCDLLNSINPAWYFQVGVYPVVGGPKHTGAPLNFLCGTPFTTVFNTEPQISQLNGMPIADWNATNEFIQVSDALAQCQTNPPKLTGSYVSLNDFPGAAFFLLDATYEIRLMIRNEGISAWDEKFDCVTIPGLDAPSECLDFRTSGIAKRETGKNEDTAGVSTLEVMQLFPNPTHGIINMYLEGTGEVSVALFDISGRLVKNLGDFYVKKSAVNALDLSVAQPGVYMLKVISGEHVTVFRLLRY